MAALRELFDSDSDEDFLGFRPDLERNSIIRRDNFSDIEVSSVSSVDLTSDESSDESSPIPPIPSGTWNPRLQQTSRVPFTGTTPGAVETQDSDFKELDFVKLFFSNEMIEVSTGTMHIVLTVLLHDRADSLNNLLSFISRDWLLKPTGMLAKKQHLHPIPVGLSMATSPSKRCAPS